MEEKVLLCDFCWNDDERAVFAKISYVADDGGEYHACAKHSEGVKAAGMETTEVPPHDFDSW